MNETTAQVAATGAAAAAPADVSTSSPLPPAAAAGVAMPQVRDRCHVRWRGGEQLLLAEIVAMRPSSRSLPSAMAGASRTAGTNRKRKSVGDSTATAALSGEDPSSSTAAEASSLSSPHGTIRPESFEYYVHYVGHDRRLDEWIAYGAIQEGSLRRAGTAGAASGDAGNSELQLQDPIQQQLQQQQQQQQPRQSVTMMRRRSSGALTAASSSDYERMALNGGDASLDDENNDSSSAMIMGGGNYHPEGEDPSYEKEHEETTKVKNVERIVMGRYSVQCWYYSPFPPEAYSNVSTLYVCEYCLSYMKKVRTYRNHVGTCDRRCPPGRRIYQDGDLSVYEIDGKDHKAFCQKLCLVSKLFLDHKTLYYDVNPFWFYVVCLDDAKGSRMVGYFSKEKVSEVNNLACILTLPQYQTRGYGKFIISLSYELTKREGRTGSPEKPLSDLGKVSYRSYWTHVLLCLLKDHDPHKDISIAEMSRRTGINPDDIISTLQSLDLVKVWKGQHVALIKQSMLRSYLKEKPDFRQCNPEFLDWQPPAPTR